MFMTREIIVPDILEPFQGVVRAKSIEWHAAGCGSKFISIETSVLSLIKIHQKAAEHEHVKGLKTQDLYGLGCWASIPSPVLLFELELYMYSSCSTNDKQTVVYL